MNGKKFNLRITVSILFLGFALNVAAQTSSTPATNSQSAKPIQKRRTTTVATAPTVIVQHVPNAPQVVTLLHRLSGLKMFRLLLRSGEARAIERLDDQFTITGEVHTNVIAGLALDDGGTVAAWLPEADAEVGPPLPPEAPKAQGTAQSAAGTTRTVEVPERLFGFYEPPNLTVVARDRRKLPARYVGIDGVTGLSILKLAQNNLAASAEMVDAAEKTIAVGQRVHLFAPEPVASSQSTKRGPVYARLGETEARITRVLQAPTGGIARVQIASPKLSPVNIGGVVLNDAGQTLGIIDKVDAGEATVLPATLIRGAAKRVLERQASVPRPWLGISGEPLGAMPVQQLLQNGWQPEGATTFARHGSGILLTSVFPGSPASSASLLPGDVILTVNDGIVSSVEDFSWVLEEAGPGGLLRFTYARPGTPGTQAVEVKLTEARDPFFGLRRPGFAGVAATRFAGLETKARQFKTSASLLANGLETIALLPKVASRLGSTGGLLVVYVEPATTAFKAGLKPGDVIEAINGNQLNEGPAPKLNEPGTTYMFTVVRNKQKFIVTLESKEKQ